MNDIELVNIRRLDSFFLSKFSKKERRILNLNDLASFDIPNVYLMEIRYDGIPSGALEIVYYKDILDIKIVMLPYYRHQGIAKSAILKAVDLLGHNITNIKRFTMQIEDDDTKAIALAKSCGFSYNKNIYSKRNKGYDAKSLTSSGVAFSKEEDTSRKIRIEVNNKIYDIYFKNTYDGMNITGFIPVKIEKLVSILSYLTDVCSPVYTDSFYFTYNFKISYKTNISNVIRLFKEKGFFCDDLESSEDILVFKKENIYYQEKVGDILRRSRNANRHRW